VGKANVSLGAVIAALNAAPDYLAQLSESRLDELLAIDA
jgi:hypothetical protein